MMEFSSEKMHTNTHTPKRPRGKGGFQCVKREERRQTEEKRPNGSIYNQTRRGNTLGTERDGISGSGSQFY